jgi:hypothetical protein
MIEPQYRIDSLVKRFVDMGSSEDVRRLLLLAFGGVDMWRLPPLSAYRTRDGYVVVAEKQSKILEVHFEEGSPAATVQCGYYTVEGRSKPEMFQKTLFNPSLDCSDFDEAVAWICK